MKLFRARRLDFHMVPDRWDYAERHRAEIDAHFAAARRANPRLWNGRVLVLRDWAAAAGAVTGSFIQTDYASFRTWLDRGRPDAGVWDCFAAAVVISNDGAVLLGEMAAHTANAGRIYFPCGTPDLDDVAAGRVDFDRSMTRELAEETGLDPARMRPDADWTIVEDRARLVAFRVMRAPWSGDDMKDRVQRFLAEGREDELAAVHLARGPQDVVAAMPDYVVAFLERHWS